MLCVPGDVAVAATLTVRLRGRSVARTTWRVGAGRQRLAVRGRFAARAHDVRVSVRTGDGAASTDVVLLHLGGRLTIRAARTAVERALVVGEIESCRRTARRRVACTVDADGDRMTFVARLGRAGVIRAGRP